MAKKRKKRDLQRYAEAFALDLISQATGGRLGRKSASSEDDKENPVSFKDRRALLDSVTKLLAAQKAPEEEDESGVNNFRERLRNGDSGPPRDGAETSSESSDAE